MQKSADTITVRRFRAIATLPLLILIVSQQAAAEEVLVAEVWIDRSPVLPAALTPEATGDEVAEALLQEARYTFSGMIYGFDFVYTPSDRARDIPEVFALDPVATVPWGATGLDVISTRHQEYRTYGRFYFYPDRDQEARLAAWSSAALPRSTAEARAPIVDGRVAKYHAIEEAVREAIRGYLRTRVDNKPREIRGAVVFVEPPRLRLAAGSYIARVKIAMRIDDVRGYEHY